MNAMRLRESIKSFSICLSLLVLSATGLVLAEEKLLVRERRDAKGQLEKRWHVYVKDGKEIYHGSCVIYWDNGNKKSECNMLDGKTSGEIVQWYRDGQKLCVSFVRDGEMDGTSTAWYPTGGVRYVAKYKEGTMFSLDSFAPNGSPTGATTFKDGKPWDGTWVEDNIEDVVKQISDAAKAGKSKVTVTLKSKTFKSGQVVSETPHTLEIPLSH